MHISEVVRYWIKSAKLDMEAAESLLQNGKFTHCLFFGHLSLEKLLKATYVKVKKTHAPYTHDLIKLGYETGLALSSEMASWLPEISTFNIRARYLDAKFKFYKKCTSSFTKNRFARIKEIYQWVLENAGL